MPADVIMPNAGDKDPEYFFLYNKAFLGFEPPMHVLVFCIGPALLYLCCVFYIFPLFTPKSRSAVILFSKLRYWHNVFMFLFSLVCFIVSSYEGYIAHQFKFVTLNLQDMMPMLCNENSDNLKWWYQIFLISKIYEWVDTAFLVWLKNDNARTILKEESDKKKKIAAAAAGKPIADVAPVARVTTTTTTTTGAAAGAKKKGGEDAELNFLHLYHHATTFWLYLMMENLPGMQWAGINFNALIHTAMYLHYAKPLPFPFLITISQIIQLGFGTWIWYLGFQHCTAHKNFMDNHWYDYLAPWFAAPVYLLFFIKFFVQRFVLKPLGIGAPKKEKSEKKEQ